MRREGLRYRDPIVFARTERDEKSGRVLAASKLWVMENDGSGLRQITFGRTREDHPSFYSDQRHILYAEHSPRRPAGGRDSKLVKLDIYTGGREILAEASGRCNMNHPSLSPIGDLVAYQFDCSKPSQHEQRVGVGEDGYAVNAIAHNGVALPNGIVFMHEKDYMKTGTDQYNRNRKVAIARMFGHGPGGKMVFLTGDRHLNRRPAVSPDGKWLAWQTNAAGGDDEIFLAGIDGSNARNLTNAPGNDGHPWFSQDGKWIVFESDRTGTWEIWKLNIATLKATRLTFGGRKYSSTRARM
jgi:Tol biopolymer transport system component